MSSEILTETILQLFAIRRSIRTQPRPCFAGGGFSASVSSLVLDRLSDRGTRTAEIIRGRERIVCFYREARMATVLGNEELFPSFAAGRERLSYLMSSIRPIGLIGPIGPI